MLEPRQIEELERTVAEAQKAGRKQIRARSTMLGGKEIEGSPLRWVEVERPAVVYFPDAHWRRSIPGAVMTVLLVSAAIALILAIVSATESDWLFLAIFGAATLALGGGGVWLDLWSSRREAAAREGVETRGLYLTPTAMVLRDHRGVTAASREQVVRFGARNVASNNTGGAKFVEFVELSVNGRKQIVDLQKGTDAHQRECCTAWLKGEWPPPLPR